jgi:hypothetical protein
VIGFVGVKLLPSTKRDIAIAAVRTIRDEAITPPALSEWPYTQRRFAIQVVNLPEFNVAVGCRGPCRPPGRFVETEHFNVVQHQLFCDRLR